MSNHCCVVWEGLAPELQEAKSNELKDVKPKSLVFPLLKVLKDIGNFCPVCGELLVQRDAGVQTPARRVVQADPEAPGEDLTEVPKFFPCPPKTHPVNPGCGGSGMMSGNTVCGICAGEGKLPNPSWAAMAADKATMARQAADKRQEKRNDLAKRKNTKRQSN